MQILACGFTMLTGYFLLAMHRSEAALTSDEPGLHQSVNIAKLKIVGGSNAQRGKYPWQTLLLIKKQNQVSGTLTLCGGTLIRHQWVLTAAHCVENSAKMRAYFGVWNVTNKIEVGRVTRTAKRIIRHPCYDGSEDASFTGYNLALIELKNPVYDFPYACLDREESHDWKRLTQGKSLGGCVATGYGVTDTGKDAEILQKVDFSTVSMTTCNAYGKIASENKILCASDDRLTGKDTCKGDMGGPLVCPTSRNGCGGSYLVGITLAGSSKCGEEGKPGIYAAVFPNLPWISSVTNGKRQTGGKKAYNCDVKPIIKKKTFDTTVPDGIAELRLREVQITSRP